MNKDFLFVRPSSRGKKMGILPGASGGGARQPAPAVSGQDDRARRQQELQFDAADRDGEGGPRARSRRDEQWEMRRQGRFRSAGPTPAGALAPDGVHEMQYYDPVDDAEEFHFPDIRRGGRAHPTRSEPDDSIRPEDLLPPLRRADRHFDSPVSPPAPEKSRGPARGPPAADADRTPVRVLCRAGRCAHCASFVLQFSSVKTFGTKCQMA